MSVTTKGGEPRPLKIAFCVPTLLKPYPQFVDSLKASIPLFDAAGFEHCAVSEVGNPYISQARNVMLRKALDAKADVIIFLDHDLSWKPEDLLKLVQTEGEVVAGTYRYKKEPEEYMGTVYSGLDGTPAIRPDGCIAAQWIPAGFLKVTAKAVDQFMGAYPHLLYGPRYSPFVDLFNHGAHNGTWYGEDYAFSRNWLDCGGKIWLVPDLDLTHHASDGKAYQGNFHRFMLRQPGGSDEHLRT
jgi:glycosyltransferase involved in cell wall biosynthesis